MYYAHIDDAPDGGDDKTWRGFKTLEDCTDKHKWDGDKTMREGVFDLAGGVLFCMFCACIPGAVMGLIAKSSPFNNLAPAMQGQVMTVPHPVQPGAPAVLPLNWSAANDPQTGQTYYHNTVTQETSWTVPQQMATGTVVNPAPAPAAQNLPQEWQQATDPNTGSTYYHNTVTGATQWEPPRDDSLPNKQ